MPHMWINKQCIVDPAMRLAANQSKPAKPDTISVRARMPANMAKLDLVANVVEWDADKPGNAWFAIVKKV